MMLRGLVHCALALAVAFAGIGTLYLSLGAQFLGLAQLLVYVGAIAVLIVFVILLTRGGDSDSPPLSQAACRLAACWWRRRYSRVLAWAVLHSFAIHPAGAARSSSHRPPIGHCLDGQTMCCRWK